MARVLLVPLVFVTSHVFGCLLSDMLTAARTEEVTLADVEPECAPEAHPRLLRVVASPVPAHVSLGVRAKTMTP